MLLFQNNSEPIVLLFLALSPPQRGIYCFECDAQKTPDSCRDVVMCDFGYVSKVCQDYDELQVYLRMFSGNKNDILNNLLKS